MSNESRTTISFTLPLDASMEEVREVIGLIEDFYSGVAKPADLIGKPASASQTVATSTLINNKTGEIEIPWDERIHASTKEKTADGSWRKRRGVDKELVAKVEAELRAAVAAPTAAPAAPLPPATAPSLPPLPGAGLPPLPGANVQTDFTKVVEVIAQNMQSPANPAGRLTADYVQQFMAHYQVPNGDVQNLAHNPALATTVLAALRQTLGLV